MNAPVRTRIEGARLLDPASGLDAVRDVWLADGRIAAIGAAPAGFSAERSVQAHGLLLLPGLVDLAARVREPGAEHKADMESETRAAAAWGITSLCLPPDTQPVADTPAVLELVRRRAKASGHARVYCLGALTQGLHGEQLSEMAALKAAGAPAVGQARRPMRDARVLRHALEYAASHDLTVFFDAEDAALAAGGCAHEGAIAARLGLTGVPVAAETAALAQALTLADETGARLHVCRLSSARGVDLLALAQSRGVAVSADVAMHQLHLTDEALAGFNAQAHVRPPLRTADDRAALRDAVRAGVIGAICSDHQPHEPDAKLAPFPETEPGISALETLLPLGLRLVEEGLLDWPTLVARLCSGPADILRLPAGRLAVGGSADLFLLDTAAAWTLEPTALLSRGRNTPFAGWSFKGLVRATWFEGRQVHAA
jgi:dihydroorotase